MYKSLVACLTLTFMAQAAFAQDVAQTMRQWWVECGPRGYCTAEVNAFSNDNDVITVRLIRSSEENSPILVSVTAELSPAPGNTATFDVPGVVSGITGTIGNVNDNTFTFSEPTNSNLIKGFRLGSTMTITIDFQGELGKVAFNLPLAGAVDSLTIMDIAQQRLGRVDAAVAIGAMPADSWSDLFPSMGEEVGGEDMGGLVDEEEGGDAHMEEGPNGAYVDLLYTEDDLPDAVRRFAYEDAACRDFSNALNDLGAILNRDQTGRKTYLVPCLVGKANVGYYVVIHDPDMGSDYELQRFQLPPAHNKPDRVIILNPQWRPWDGDFRLISIRYGNVNLNCGAYEVHAFYPEQQLFELELYKHKKQCNGPQTQPIDFPVEWSIDEMGD